MSISDVKLGHQITEAVGLIDYKMCNCTQITFNSGNK